MTTANKKEQRMKKIFWSVTLLAAMASCYEDKGNYDYRFDDMNAIESVSFEPEAAMELAGLTIELTQPLGTDPVVERIEATPKQTLAADESNLEYTWIRSYTKDKKRVTDTIYTQGYVEVELQPNTDTSYGILLMIKDKTTTLTHYTKLSVLTRPIFKNSLFVIHGAQGNRKLGNIEFLKTGTEIHPNAYAKVNPDQSQQNPFATSEAMIYTAYLNMDWATYKSNISNNLCVFSADGTANLYNPFGLKKKNLMVFPYDVPSMRFGGYACTGAASNESSYKVMWNSDGQFYLERQYFSFLTPGAGATSSLHETDYSISAATINDSKFVLWDQKNTRFLTVAKAGENNFPYDEQWANSSVLNAPVLDANVDFSSLSADLQPAGKKAVYAYTQYAEDYENSNSFFIMRDDAGKFYLYELTATSDGEEGDKKSKLLKDDGKGDEGGSEIPTVAFTVKAKALPNVKENCIVSTLLYNTLFSENYFFYAAGGNVYRYEIKNNTSKLLYSAPEGYTVSVMKFAMTDTGNKNQDYLRRLFIGLSNGTDGAVADLQLAPSSDVDGEVSLHEGFGPVKDVQFAYDYYETLSNPN